MGHLSADDLITASAVVRALVELGAVHRDEGTDTLHFHEVTTTSEEFSKTILRNLLILKGLPG